MGAGRECDRDGGGDPPALGSAPHARHLHDSPGALATAGREAALVTRLPQLPCGCPAQGTRPASRCDSDTTSSCSHASPYMSLALSSPKFAGVGEGCRGIVVIGGSDQITGTAQIVLCALSAAHPLAACYLYTASTAGCYLSPGVSITLCASFAVSARLTTACTLQYRHPQIVSQRGFFPSHLKTCILTPFPPMFPLNVCLFSFSNWRFTKITSFLFRVL